MRMYNTNSGKKLMSVMAASAAFTVIGSTSSSFAVNAASINPGTSGSTVTALQKELKSQGYFKANCTGYYGNITKNAVSKFQKDNGLKATGTVDDVTYDAIFGTSSSSSSSFTGKGTVTASYLNVRSGPGTNYSIIGGFSRGATVNITDKQGSWYKIKLSSSKNGWVSSDYISLNGSSNTNNSGANNSNSSNTGSNSKNNSTSTSKKIVVTADTLNARSSASTSGSIVGTVKKNEVYVYTSTKNGWYQVTIPSGKKAYISGDYVKSFTSYPIKGGGSYIWPVQTSKRITSYYGETGDRNHTHKGIDIAASSGSQIIAVASGKVIVNAYEKNGFGYYVVIQQNDGIKAYYGHMKQASFLTQGSTVQAGQTIGMVGSTGASTGPHLHLEFRNSSGSINPLKYYPNIK